MPKIHTEEMPGFYLHYPTLVCIVTTKGFGKENAMACAWHSPISAVPRLYGVSISPRRYTYDLILNSGQFAINFVPFEKAELVAQMGAVSGRDMDKLARFGIETEAPLKLQCPILKDAYASYECQLYDHHTYGDHEWLVGEIVAIHYLEEATTAENMINLANIRPTLYLGAERYLSSASEVIVHLDREKYRTQ